MTALPAGEVTFAFVDVVGSTKLLERHGDAFVDALARVQSEVAETTRAAGGAVVSTAGDGAFLAFQEAEAALAALTRIQQLRDGDRAIPSLQLRAGGHRGRAVPIDDDYVALAVHVAARVASAARARQILVTGSLSEAIGGPRPDWRDLGDRLLRDVAAPTRLYLVSGPADEPAAPPARRTNVADPHTSFVGRETLLHDLAGSLHRPGVTTIVGPGGLGKTRLASEVALRLQRDFVGGAWLVELSPVAQESDVVTALASVLDAEVGADDPVAALVRTVRGSGKMLLVLDNCEHVIDAAADLADALVQGAPEVSLLCTSREPLDVTGERVVRPPSLLDAPGADGLSSAGRLFVARAQGAGAVIDADDYPKVEAICADLDGLPLAVELAASRVADTPLSLMVDVAHAPAEHVDTLRRRGGEPRQRTLEAVVRWSFDRLTGPQRTALLVLSVLPGSYTGSTAARLLGAVHGIPITREPGVLARCSLLDVDGDRFRMLHTIRSMAAAWLADDPPLEEASRQALLEWADEWARERLGNRVDEFRADLRLEMPNVVAAVEVGVVLRSELIARPAEALARSTARRATLPEIVALGRQVLDLAHGDAEPWLRARLAALVILDGGGIGGGAEPMTLDDHRRLIRAIDATRDKSLRAWARIRTGQVIAGSADGEHAAGFLEEALELCSPGPDVQALRARVMTSYGYVLHVDGELERAVTTYSEAIEMSIEGGDSENAAVALANLAEALLDLDRPLDALAAAQRALRYVAAMDPAGIAAETYTGEAYAAIGAVDEGRRILERQAQRVDEIARLDPSYSFIADRIATALQRLAQAHS